jgi:curli production assembly/transport component CsgG
MHTMGILSYGRRRLTAAALLAVCVVAGCDFVPEYVSMDVTEPTPQATTNSLSALRSLPLPDQPLFVAVYRFEDLTGQNKPGGDYAEYSKAVSQGGATILVNALREAGDSQWFNVLEREQLGPLLEERKLIRAARETFASENGQMMQPLPALLNAGVLLAGGVIGYDTNTSTGGYGARYLGIGADQQYRQDNVSVYLRAVSVTNGRVLASVVANKTVFSMSNQVGVFSYVTTNSILELEAGITTNEPRHLALKQAIESAVYNLVLAGSEDELWHFKDPKRKKQLLAERDSALAIPSDGRRMKPATLAGESG